VGGRRSGGEFENATGCVWAKRAKGRRKMEGPSTPPAAAGSRSSVARDGNVASNVKRLFLSYGWYLFKCTILFVENIIYETIVNL
jgi:hypothetical protein